MLDPRKFALKGYGEEDDVQTDGDQPAQSLNRKDAAGNCIENLDSECDHDFSMVGLVSDRHRFPE